LPTARFLVINKLKHA